jgi:N-acetylmuramoyl-L-alanine amidase
MRVLLRMTAKCLGLMLAVACFIVQTGCAVLQFDNSYYSQHNRERSVRKSTTLIVLHTTEAPSSSALRKLSDLGECNYCVTENGRVYRIIDRNREAYHAGRSMWNGKSDVDSFSVGIEICGYHNKPLTAAQYRSVADLVGELKSVYHIPDQNVISHAHVAYGTPNKWHRRSHRGRKRCGMLFALPSIRARLGLRARPAYDPDVRAGRLVNGDPYLAQVLYGPVKGVASAKPLPPEKESNVIAVGRSAWTIARDAYNDPGTVYTFPNGTVKRGNQIGDFSLLPVGTKVVVNAPNENRPDTYAVIGINGKAADIAGDESGTESTVYVYPKTGKFCTGNKLSAQQIQQLPYGTKVLVGYKYSGPIMPSRPATSYCGNKWRSRDTFFLINGELISGDKVDDSKIPLGCVMFYKG